jgi:hypothetical protein
MLRILIGGLLMVFASSCSGGDTSTATSTTMTFSGAVAGVTTLSGEGVGHLCGRQGNGTYLASMRASVSGEPVVVSVQLEQYSGPSNYDLGSGRASVTLTLQQVANPIVGGSVWTSASGHLTVDVADDHAGTIDATLKQVGQVQSSSAGSDVKMSGHWTCARSASSSP